MMVISWRGAICWTLYFIKIPDGKARLCRLLHCIWVVTPEAVVSWWVSAALAGEEETCESSQRYHDCRVCRGNFSIICIRSSKANFNLY